MFARVLTRHIPWPSTTHDLGVSVGGVLTSVERAYEALRSVAPGLTQKQYVQLLGQAKAETDFGDGFETPDGSSSNNWGAIYAPGDLGTLTRTDYTPDGKPITVKAAWNSSPEVGAKQFYDLIRKNYAPALERAADGDLWGYSEALWRNGPCSWQQGICTRPAYYVGFPPGNKNGLAPKSVTQGSEADRWYRITAYARFIEGGIRSVNKALGWSNNYVLSPPPNPDGGLGLGSIILLGAVAAGGYGLWRVGGLAAASRLIGGM